MTNTKILFFFLSYVALCTGNPPQSPLVFAQGQELTIDTVYCRFSDGSKKLILKDVKAYVLRQKQESEPKNLRFINVEINSEQYDDENEIPKLLFILSYEQRQKPPVIRLLSIRDPQSQQKFLLYGEFYKNYANEIKKSETTTINGTIQSMDNKVAERLGLQILP